MTAEDVRRILADRFVTEWPARLPNYDFFIDGINEPDFKRQEKPFCFFRVSLPHTYQSGFDGDTPPLRGEGHVEFVFFVREGDGTKPFFEMYDAMISAFCSQVVDRIRLTEAIPYDRPSALGWQSRRLRVNFNYDSTA